MNNVLFYLPLPCICVFVYMSAGLHKNYQTHFHDTWCWNSEWSTEEDITVLCQICFRIANKLYFCTCAMVRHVL